MDPSTTVSSQSCNLLSLPNALPIVDLDARRRMAVQVMVEGQGPFSFLVDTGAERTVIARELAERLGLGRSEKLRLATIGVGTAIAPSFRVASLHMTHLRLQPIDPPALAVRPLRPAGLSGLELPRATPP